ncbi:non-ribosomal peptide synthetase [Streptacidiphilus sp. 4-A2]|nr:non-ribosomal peptide synthetase [Streptacidiphilus sp. 4-A2]
MLTGAGCAVLLVDGSTHAHEAGANLRLIRADTDTDTDTATDAEEAVEPVPFADRTVGPGALLYVMHTSGSTGTPKGVAVTHRNVTAFAADRAWRGGAHERVLLHSPHAFDAATYELWVPLLNGGRVVIAPGPLDVTLLRRLAGGRRITAAFLTVGLFNALAGADASCFEGMRELWTGGDVVTPDAVQQVRKACPGISVHAGYGPTEVTVFATCYRATEDLDGGQSVPIGTAMDNTRAYVLDDSFRPVPPGTAGELYIAGAGVARGYLNQPGLTAQRFLPDPFGTSGERMYATGDLARRDDEGNLRFIGRADGQVKISGFRIETGEIEAALAGHPGIRQAAVLAEKSGEGGGRIRAYVVSAGPGTDRATIRDWLAERLPGYMVPGEYVFLPGLPLTPNGKVDRALLAAQPAAPDGGTQGRAEPTGRAVPADGTQARVAELWALVLGTEQIGLDDNFFECGGTSLKLIGLHARLCDAFAVELPIQRLFDVSTIRAMARYLAAGGSAAADSPAGASTAADERAAARRDQIRRRAQRQ